jgi:hypothetical protein
MMAAAWCGLLWYGKEKGREESRGRWVRPRGEASKGKYGEYLDAGVGRSPNVTTVSFHLQIQTPLSIRNEI